MLLPWTPLARSRREHTLVRLLLALCAATVLALLVAAAASPDWPAYLAIALGVSVAAVAAARSHRGKAGFEVAVDARGRIAMRRADEPAERPEQRLQCVFAAAWLITLRRGTMLIPIWPDSVPADAFRRLWVHIRWSSARAGAEGLADRMP